MDGEEKLPAMDSSPAMVLPAQHEGLSSSTNEKTGAVLLARLLVEENDPSAIAKELLYFLETNAFKSPDQRSTEANSNDEDELTDEPLVSGDSTSLTELSRHDAPLPPKKSSSGLSSKGLKKDSSWLSISKKRIRRVFSLPAKLVRKLFARKTKDHGRNTHDLLAEPQLFQRDS